MKINPLQGLNRFGKTVTLDHKKVLLKNKMEGTTDKFVPGNSHKKVVTYNKQTVKTDRTLIAALQKESEKAYESLRRIVAELLEKQGQNAQHVKGKELEGLGSLEIDEAARTEAANLIAEDGPLGIEAVSNRIVDFAIALSGGDKSRLPEIKGAIEEGFRQASNMLGGLPEISLKTYDAIMKKLATWEKGE